jgi:hypothetical protein
MCVYTDRTLKLSGLRPIIHERVKGGWNVAIEFPEKRPKGTNPVYKGILGVALAIAEREAGEGKKGRLTNVREIVFFPELKHDTSAYSPGEVLDQGSYTVSGFSRFFRQTEYEQMNNSLYWAKKVGSFTTPNKVSDENNSNQFLVIQKDSDGNPLENTYPMRYMMVKGEWVPQVVYNLEVGRRALDGTPSRVEPKKILGKIIPTVSGVNAGTSGAFDPINGRGSKPTKAGFVYMPDWVKSAEEKVTDAQMGQLETKRADFEASKGYKSPKAEKFNGIKGLEKILA